MKSSPCTKSFLLPKFYCSSSNCIWPEVQRGRPAPALGRNTDGCCRRCVKYGHYSQHCICFQTSALNYCHLVHLKLGWVSAKLCSERCLDEDESCYVVVFVSAARSEQRAEQETDIWFIVVDNRYNRYNTRSEEMVPTSNPTNKDRDPIPTIHVNWHWHQFSPQSTPRYERSQC